MKLFKQLEIIINLVILIIFALVFLFTRSYEFVFAGCLLMGGLQLLSTVIHVTKGWFSNHNLRISYYILLLLSAALLLTDIGTNLSLLAATFMALFYLFICYREFQILKFRESVHLK